MKKIGILTMIIMVVLVSFITNIPIMIANDQSYTLEKPIVHGNPSIWTNEPISLTIEKKDNDFMYSFSEISGCYKWQKQNVSREYGNNTIVYASVMDKNGVISEECEVIIDKVDMIQSKVNVTHIVSNDSVDFYISALDASSGIAEYSFDGGKTWQENPQSQISDTSEINIQVKDKAGNITEYNKTYFADLNYDKPSLYSICDVFDDKGNRFSELKVENYDEGYEYNLSNEKKWNQNKTKRIAYKANEIYKVKRRKKNNNARVMSVEEEVELASNSYPVLNGPAILQEKGMIRLVGQGKYGDNSSVIIESDNGKYTIDGYEYQIQYSFDLTNWKTYTVPENILPSDYGKTLYARLSGVNNSYISKKVLVNDDIKDLVSYYEPKQQISESLLTYEDVDNLLNTKFTLGYESTQFRDETNTTESTHYCNNIISFSLEKNANRTALKQQYMVATQAKDVAHENCYFEDLSGNRIDYDYSMHIAWFADEKRHVAYHMCGDSLSSNDNDGILDSISDQNGNTLKIKNRNTNPTVEDFNGYEYVLKSDGIHFPTDVIIDGDSYKKEGFQTYHLERNCDVTYDSDGKIIELEYDDGTYKEYEYTIENNRLFVVKEITSNDYHISKYDLNFDLVMEEDSNGFIIDYQNNCNGDVILEETDEKTNIYDYDDEGNMTSGSVKQAGEMNAELIVTNTYDSHNNLTSQKTKDFPEAKYEYDNKHNMTKSSIVVQEESDTQDEICENVIYQYDTEGNLISETDESTHIKTVNTYDDNNNLLSSSNIGLIDNTSVNLETCEYDELGRSIRKVDGDYTNTYVYDQLGNVLLKCENDVYTRYVYDSKARLIQEISGSDYVADEDGLNQNPISDSYNNANKGKRYIYDNDGKLIRVISSLGYETENVYDENGKLIKTYPDIYQTVYTSDELIERYRVNGYTKLLNTYDTDKKLLKTAYSNSQNVQYVYDEDSEQSNLIGKKFNQDSELRFQYSYDNNGKKVEIRDVKSGLRKRLTDDGFTTYNIDDNTLYHAYHTNQNIITETANGNTYVSDAEENYRVWKKNDVSFVSCENEYSLEGKLNRVTNTLYDDSQSLTLVETPAYDKEMITNLAVSGMDERTYNFKYTYDDYGNIKRAWGSLYNSHFTYDSKNQLTKVINSTYDKTTLYTYDDRGNMTSEISYDKDEYASHPESATILESITYSYENDLWEDQLTRVNNKEITYDGVGNRTSYDGWTYTWEGGRQLSSMSKENTTITYKYDDSGIRTEKTVGDKTYRYTTISGAITSQSDGVNNIYFFYDNEERIYGFELNGKPYLYLRNNDNDVIGITDESGVKLVQYQYDAWGKVIDIIGDTNLANLNPIRYRGYYYDNETGLYYLQSRYYDPSVRRFINADDFEMIGKTDTLSSYNLYVYCDNNPVNHADAKGNLRSHLIGFGLQLQLVMKGNEVGVELIWYSNPRVKVSKTRWSPYGYAFYGANTRGNAANIWDYVRPERSILPIIRGFCSPKYSFGAVAVFGYEPAKNEKRYTLFNSPDDYAGISSGYGTTINHIYLSVGYSSSGFSVSAGYSKQLFDFDINYNHYVYLNKKKIPNTINSAYNNAKSGCYMNGIV